MSQWLIKMDDGSEHQLLLELQKSHLILLIQWMIMEIIKNLQINPQLDLGS